MEIAARPLCKFYDLRCHATEEKWNLRFRENQKRDLPNAAILVIVNDQKLTWCRNYTIVGHDP